jgi:hypothetical protein
MTKMLSVTQNTVNNIGIEFKHFAESVDFLLWQNKAKLGLKNQKSITIFLANLIQFMLTFQYSNI